MIISLIVNLQVLIVHGYIPHEEYSQRASNYWNMCTQVQYQTQCQPLNQFVAGIPGEASTGIQKPLGLHSVGKVMELVKFCQ